jgi:cysteinyl-tRNA synthetase
MSKSSGDFLRLQTLIDQGFDPLAYRMLCLSAHYRSQLNFSWEALKAAQTGLNRLRETYLELPNGGVLNQDFAQRFQHEVNQDLNLPKGLALMWELLKSNLPEADKKITIDHFDLVLGLDLANWRPKENVLPEAVLALIEQRKLSRQNKNWAESDRLRNELNALGYEVEDSAGSMNVKPRSTIQV